MFEKQQKRMDRYTKESNGVNQPLIAPLQASYSGPQVPKVPGESTKANMSQVLGEFRKVSDSESPVSSLMFVVSAVAPLHRLQVLRNALILFAEQSIPCILLYIRETLKHFVALLLL